MNRWRHILSTIVESFIGLFVTAFLLRAFFGLRFGSFGDDIGEYSSYAVNYLAGKGFMSVRGPPLMAYRAFLPPLYPVMLILYLKFIGAHFVVWRLLFAAAGAATCVATAWLGQVLMGRLRGLTAGWVLCLYPPHIFWSTRFQPESWVMLFITIALLLLERSYHRFTYKDLLMAGGFVALATLGRSEFFITLPVIIMWLLLKEEKRLRKIKCLLFLFGFILVMSPWAIRNELVFHELTINTSGRGEAFYMGHNPQYNFGGVASVIPPEIYRPLEGLSENQVANGMMRAGLRYMAQHPLIAILTFIGNILVMARPFLTPGYIPWMQNFVYTIAAFPLLVFFLIGVLNLFHDRNKDLWLLLLWVVVFKIAGNLPFYVVIRFREVLAPLLILIAVFGYFSWRENHFQTRSMAGFRFSNNRGTS